ncbi:MAG: DUF4145 domain-containing protein [bacterium]|nr:DUF4145 domain-containing protein [bacterium]
MIPFKPPKFQEEAFNCPYCNAYSNQEWEDVLTRNAGFEEDLKLSYCAHCGNYSIGYKGKMILPDDSPVPLPNDDLPEDIKTDYSEARSIVTRSPRGASALLRLVIQKLLKYLGEKGINLNDDIANLVKKGLPVKIQKALDIVRVIGNNAVHPGQIDIKDDPETANELFNLVNLIADVMITQPKHIDEFYTHLPDTQKEAIRERDKRVD